MKKPITNTTSQIPTEAMFSLAKTILDGARADGHTPSFFVMSEATSRAMGSYEAQRLLDGISSLKRIIHRFRHRNAPQGLSTLHGLPVQSQPFLPFGHIALAVAGPVSHANRLGTVQRQSEAAQNGDTPTLDQLATSNGKVSPSDILIKAMTDIDHIKQVVVIRVHDNNDVTMSMNCNTFEANGILTKAMHWLMMQG